MGKPKQARRLAETEAQAVVRNLRVSPRKLNLVAGLIRNQDAGGRGRDAHVQQAADRERRCARRWRARSPMPRTTTSSTSIGCSSRAPRSGARW